jgi:hypothetical protein
MANPNLVNVTSIYANSINGALTTTVIALLLRTLMALTQQP